MAVAVFENSVENGVVSSLSAPAAAFVLFSLEQEISFSSIR